MTISLRVLGEASNGPKADGNRPSMLSVGDSLMWGQGLDPGNRFRELVRQRLANELGDPLVELSLARSGAKLDPSGNPGTDTKDADISSSIYTHPDPAINPFYSPAEYAREVPYPVLTTRQQLIDAHKLLEDDAAASPGDIRWIILDGGINDVGINGILSPFPAIADGYFLSGWSAWLLDQSKRIKNEMVETLRIALDLFVNAVVVVNGYFPVFSYWSIGDVVKLQSVGVLHAISNLFLFSGYGLDALASASSTWQAASNKHLRAAIRKVRRERSERTILFARSQIEEKHSLFAPQSWLWGYDKLPDWVPTNIGEWVQWLAGATPEDEVITERLLKCRALVVSETEGVSCRLASIGHPNIEGAIDYANSIIEALENGGIISSNLNDCALGTRRRKKKCRNFSDEWSYGCANFDAKVGKSCADFVRQLGQSSLGHFRNGARSLANSGEEFKRAAECFTTQGRFAQVATKQFERAANNLENAADHIQAAADCWHETEAELQACDDAQASNFAACNAAYHAADTGPCNITCTQFERCRSRYGRYDPRRYTCLAARGVCVAAAAVARGTCLTAASVIREACKVAAAAKNVACKLAVTGGNTVCSAVEATKAAGQMILAGAHALAGSVAAVGELGSDGLCALRHVAKGAGQVGKAIGQGLAGAFVGIFAGISIVGCKGFAWLGNRLCRFGNWATRKFCEAGSLVITGACYIALASSIVTKTLYQRGEK